MTEQEKTDKAMAALGELSGEWWKTAGSQWQAAIVEMCAMIPGPFKERFYDWFSGAMRQAHAEGLYEGFCAGKDLTQEQLQSERDALKIEAGEWQESAGRWQSTADTAVQAVELLTSERDSMKRQVEELRAAVSEVARSLQTSSYRHFADLGLKLKAALAKGEAE